MPDSTSPNITVHLSRKSPHKKIFIILSIILALSLSLVLIAKFFPQTSTLILKSPLIPKTSTTDIKRFTSEAEFKDYLQTTSQFANYASQGLARSADDRPSPEGALSLGAPTDASIVSQPSRISTTNVQVVGIDEPDILKTNGKQLYYSNQTQFFGEPIPLIEPNIRTMMPETSSPGSPGISFEKQQLIAPDRFPYPYPQPQTQVIAAFPPAELAKLTNIDKQGDLLLHQQTLLIFTVDGLYAYDVSNPASPSLKWDYRYQDNHQLKTARLYNNQLYIITHKGINYQQPCPITPLTLNTAAITIPCTDIYYPITPTTIDTTFIALIINPETGQLQDKTAFVGANDNSVIYMSPQALYVTYTLYPHPASTFFKFISESGQDLFPASLIARLNKLQTYELTPQSQLTELQTLLQQHYQNLNDDDRLKLETELNNRAQTFAKQHSRDLQTTAIMKLGTDHLQLVATGSVPGQPLNQFSLDEYQDHLRIATTINSNALNFGFFNPPTDSANDVYILNSQLNQVGEITNLGLTERIYSARFIADRGYLVTFRQVDPFYVLDLSNHIQPQRSGELKIPGFSSYLHPLTEHLILGVGQEGNQVKLSLFDVNDPSNPSETSKYLLNEYWSEISQTHHAFLQDPDHQIFFVPAGNNAYIISYRNHQLQLLKALTDLQAKRAVFINNYLYIVGDTAITVLNETDWTEVNKIMLTG